MNKARSVRFGVFSFFLVAPFFLFSAETRRPLLTPEVMPEGITPKKMVTDVLWRGVRALPPGERPRIALVLGGGGARGLSHIGVLKVLQEEGVPIDEIAGVSIGAVIGALYSSGQSVASIEEMGADIGWNNVSNFSKAALVRLILADEMLSTSALQSYVEKHIGLKTFAELSIPFTCVATDIRTGERVVFREGSVAAAARASATIPAVFKPVEYRQRFLVDGGLVDNLPTTLLQNPGPHTIVIAVLPKTNEIDPEVKSVFKALVRAIDIQKDIILQDKKRSAEILIEPDTSQISMIDLNLSQEAMDAGVVETRKYMPALKAMLIDRVIKMKAVTSPAPAPVPAKKGKK